MIYLFFSYDARQTFKNILHQVGSYMYHYLMQTVVFFFKIAISNNYKNWEKVCFDNYFRLDILVYSKFHLLNF